jgi:cytochrome c biogenesis protein CcdA
MLASLPFAFVAGALSILSPCVLPLIPIVLGTSAAQGRWGPAALAGGLVLSFVAIGMFVAIVGFSIGLDGTFFRNLSSILLIAMGILLAVPVLQHRFSLAAGPVGDWAQNKFGSVSGEGTAGQFGLGLVMGAIWSPCVGPTLGAASLLAAQGKDLFQVALTMSAFGLGVAAPLTAIGLMSREFLARWRNRMLTAGSGLKAFLGCLLVVTGIFVLTGADKHLESALVQASPAWLTALTTRF